MNERLKELAEQAGVSFHHALGATYTYGKLSEILERFAELVRDDERKTLAQPEQKLIGWKDGEPQYVAQPEPVQVRPHEFIAMASKQADMVGKPVVWAEYPTPHKIILDEGWEWGHEARAKEALAQPEQEQEPEIVKRVRRYAGKRRESVGSPHINAKECIALANWIDSVLAQPEQVITPISPDQYERFCFTCGACTGKPWQGLTNEDIDKSWEWAQKSSPYGVTRIETFAKSIETKLKEKNDG